MQMREKGKKDGKLVDMDFGQVQDALASGAYEMVEVEGAERGPDIIGGSVGFAPGTLAGDEARAVDASTTTVEAPAAPEPASKDKSGKASA
jgi:hypothetical protein